MGRRRGCCGSVFLGFFRFYFRSLGVRRGDGVAGL